VHGFGSIACIAHFLDQVQSVYVSSFLFDIVANNYWCLISRSQILTLIKDRTDIETQHVDANCTTEWSDWKCNDKTIDNVDHVSCLNILVFVRHIYLWLMFSARSICIDNAEIQLVMFKMNGCLLNIFTILAEKNWQSQNVWVFLIVDLDV
jgi:hypothetical protein